MALPAPKPNIDTCAACGKLFPRLAIRLCSACVLVEANRFELVREFLDEHGGGSIGDIAAATGVRVGDVRAFLDGGRLVHRADQRTDDCTCGGIGERCRPCRARLAGSFRGLEQAMRSDLAADAPPSGGSATDLGGRTSYVRRVRRLGGQS